MAFTKVVGAGIHTLSNITSHNINSSGIITATKFVGPFDGSNGDFSGNVTIDGNLTVNGTTSTIDTNLIGVDKIEVSTALTNVAVAVTHTGSGDLVRLYDGTSQVVTIDDEGNVGIGTDSPDEELHVMGQIKVDAGAYARVEYARNDTNLWSVGLRDTDDFWFFRESGGANVIFQHGSIGIGTISPDAPLHILSSANNLLQLESTDRHSTLYLIDSIGSSYIQNDSGALRFGTGGGASAAGGEEEAVRITADGRVGIATYLPTAAWLDIATGSGSYDHIRMRRISSDVNIASNWSLKPYGGNLYFREGGSTDKIVFTDDPKVGIGTALPLTELHVHAADFTDITIQSDRTSGNIGGINFRKGGAATGIQTAQYFVNTNGEHFFHSQGSQRLKISSDGDLLISGADNAELKLKCGTTTGNNIIAFLNSSGTTKGNIFYDSDNDFMVFKTNGTAASNERLRITNVGRVYIGGQSGRSPGGLTPQLQIEGIDVGTSSMSLTRNSANSGGASIILNKTRGTAVNADTAVKGGDTLGILQFAGNDGGDSDNAAAWVLAKVDDATSQTMTSNVMPGRLEFYTRSDTSSGSLQNRMTIKSDGVVIINQTEASGTKLAIQSTATSGSGTATGIRVGNNIGVLSQYPANIEVRTTGVENYNAIRTDAGDGHGGFTCGVEGYNGFLDLTTGTGNTVTVKLRSNGVSYLNGGQVLIGATSSLSFNGVGGHHNLIVAGSTNNTNVVSNSNAAITISNTDGTANNTAGLHFAREDTDGTPHYDGASIVAQFLETMNTGHYPKADLAFLTSTANNNAPSEKMRIAADGRVQIAGQNAIASTSLTHRLLVRSQNDSNAIAIAGRNGDHISEISFYQSDASTKLGELEAHTTDIRLISRTGEIHLCPSGTSARATIQASSFKEIIFPQQSDNTFAQRVYRTTVSGVTAQSYTKFATVSGTELSSHIKMTTHCTIGSVVCTQDWDIKVGHHHDFFVTSTSLAYTESKIKIVSNGNQNFDLYLQRSGGASQASGATYRVVIHPMSQESVLFNSTVNYSESSSNNVIHEHSSSTGARKITASGGVGGHFIMPGTLTAGTKNFSIPHPLPTLTSKKKLVHASIEGPQMDLIYRGKTTLVSGISTVNIDTNSNMTEGTFEELNRNVQCFTTNETGWTNTKGSVTGNKITIIAQDNSCTDTISWMVVGERQDNTAKSLNVTDDDGNLIVEPAIEEDVDTSHLHELYPTL